MDNGARRWADDMQGLEERLAESANTIRAINTVPFFHHKLCISVFVIA
jgi:hypothetical protein